jgi:hypothetical protein
VDTIDEKDRVTICHIPAGNPEARHTLVIARAALDAHLKHGDVLGACEDQKEKGKPESPPSNKGNDKKPGGNPPKSSNDNALFIETVYHPVLLLAATDRIDHHQLLPRLLTDTVKVYGKARASYYHFRKTVTSRGIINFRIIDNRTNAVLRVEKLPGEYVWVSEWATFNGDERALTPEQLHVARQREQLPPNAQDMFSLFTQPIYNQLVNEISGFYRNY